MNFPQYEYRYRVESFKRGNWVSVMQTDHEDADTFRLIANAEEYQYRVLLDGEDVTEHYKNNIQGGAK